MDENSLLPLLKEIVLDVTGKPVPATISLRDNLSELGVDSVSIAEVVMRVEDTLEIEIPATQWMEARTVRDFVKLVNNIGERKVKN